MDCFSISDNPDATAFYYFAFCHHASSNTTTAAAKYCPDYRWANWFLFLLVCKQQNSKYTAMDIS
jgi:hypothetical protein